MTRLPAACLRLQRRVAESLTATLALRPREHALLMLSGGADSMALLSLVQAADRRSGSGCVSLHCTWTTGCAAPTRTVTA